MVWTARPYLSMILPHVLYPLRALHREETVDYGRGAHTFLCRCARTISRDEREEYSREMLISGEPPSISCLVSSSAALKYTSVRPARDSSSRCMSPAARGDVQNTI